MARNVFKDIVNKRLTEENEKLLNDLKLCQKRNEFLENYRKVLNQFYGNCVCDQNKITAYLFRSLERQYKQLSHNECKRKSNVKKSGKASKKSSEAKPKRDQNNHRISESIEEKTLSKPQVTGVVVPLPMNSSLDLKSVQNVISTQESESLPQTCVQTVTHSSPDDRLECIQSSTVQITAEEDSDLTFPSFNDPIFTLNANYVEELAAQVIPKIGEETTPTKVVQRTEPKNSGLKYSDNRNCDLISDKSNLKFIALLENLKKGSLQSFNDPNNDLISVFLKSFDSIDGKKVSKIVYKCNYSFCGFETNSQQYIHRHIDRHKTSKFFRSSLIKYRTFSLLLNDLKSGRLESFIDPDYELVLVTLKEVDSSEDTPNQSEITYKCLYPNCQFETFGKYYIRSHVLRHNKSKNFVCNVCKEKFETKVSRVEHQMKVHNNYKNSLFRCEFAGCAYKTTVRQSMQFHQMKHKSEKTFKCETIGCDLCFKSVYQMKNHMKRVHVLKTIVCEWPGCEASFKTKYEVQHHKLCHTGEKITVGKIRDLLKEGNYVSTVDTNNKLFSVIRQQIISESDGRIEVGPKLGYKCNFTDCKFICITPHLISEHTLSHSMGKAFECELCHKTYTLRNHLNNHKKLVHNINNKCPLLKCSHRECEYSTRNRYCFRQHERTHESSTPFKCCENGCQKTFKTNVSLKQHINNYHSSPYLLACDWPSCKSSFKSKGYLNYHKKCHLKLKETYECKHCSKTFNFKANLTKHLKSQHSVESLV